MVFLAVVAHALVILGLGFAVAPDERPVREPLDVTWVADPDAADPPPEDAERIATRDQAASGEGDQVQEATAPGAEGEGIGEPAPEGIDAPAPEETAQVEAPATPEPEPAPDRVTRESGNDRPSAAEMAEPEALEAPDAEPRPSAATLMNRGLESARATAGEERRSFSAGATRTRYVDSLAARSAPEAAYLQAWINKVERVGNLNYPGEARRQGLSGSLVLSVRLNPQGELIEIEVARSSGEPVLDQAAIRIVELAAPYAPFTDAMRAEYDELVITRTWAFRRDSVRDVR